MSRYFDFLIVGVKGFLLGLANLIPGVSGGTIALLSGIYEKLIESLNALTELSNWKRLLKGELLFFWNRVNGGFLLALTLGVLLSIFTLAGGMRFLLCHYPIQVWSFFFGLIAASSVFMLLKIKSWTLLDCLWLFLGGGIGIMLSMLSPGKTPDELWFIFICGVISICTMILPGVSGSYVLLLMGKYDYMMQILSDINKDNFTALLVFSLGCMVGLIALSKLIYLLLKKYERATMIFLLAFVLTSLIKLWPWNDINAPCISGGEPLKNHFSTIQFVNGGVFMVLGLLFSIGIELLLSSFSKKRKEARSDL